MVIFSWQKSTQSKFNGSTCCVTLLSRRAEVGKLASQKKSPIEDPDEEVESESSKNTKFWLVRRGIVFKSADFVQHLSLRE